MCRAPGQPNGGRKAEQNKREEEERGRVCCAELYGLLRVQKGGLLLPEAV
jgi:hypothetical protein